ncbi:putative Rac guanine nucleotide exchange factor B [Blattamonas nauphoetae]|uniref:Rac guanine nucleotide exchange factor B n=1 Tax=Blattamonas nauphoetae TaxID=2049346 RepID=A0ABQ9YBV7_9EUKA|nr:putative Rac guanine nucleotide exchange factor B [Blattamonas nauphoetae]
MSSRNQSQSFGLDAQNKRIMESKYDTALEAEVIAWITQKTGISVSNFITDLKDGVTLCKLMNIINPGSIKTINQTKMPFKQMENLNWFLEACRSYGLKEYDLFRTVDVYENELPMPLLNTLVALKRNAEGGGKATPSPAQRSVGSGVGSSKSPAVSPAGKSIGATPSPSSKSAGVTPSPKTSPQTPSAGPSPSQASYSAPSAQSKPSPSAASQGSTTSSQKYGLDKEAAQKTISKLSNEDIQKVTKWIEGVIKRPGDCGSQTLGQWLHSGIVLCEVINAIKPGMIKIHTKSMPFMQMENITHYCDACRTLGVGDYNNFRTDDLYEEHNMQQVVQNIMGLARAAKSVPGFSGPFLE